MTAKLGPGELFREDVWHPKKALALVPARRKQKRGADGQERMDSDGYSSNHVESSSLFMARTEKASFRFLALVVLLGSLSMCQGLLAGQSL